MLFGFCPFEEKSIASLVKLIDKKPLSFPLKVNKVSENTQNLLKKMLVVDIDKRISPSELMSHPLNLKPMENPAKENE